MKLTQIFKRTSHDEFGFVSVPAHYPAPRLSIPTVGNVFSRPNFKRNMLLVGAFAIAITGYALAVQFFIPKNVSYSFGAADCFVNPIILPGFVTPKQGTHFTAATQAAVSVGGVPLYSHKTCLTATLPPVAKRTDVVKLGVLGTNFLAKRVTIHSVEPPKALLKTAVAQPISSKGVLSFELTSHDEVFAYKLTGVTTSVSCQKQSQKVDCPLEQLQLPQGTKNDLLLQREFKTKPVESLATVSVLTLDPLKVVSSSIGSTEKVFSDPKEITIQLSKPVANIGKASLEQQIGTTKTSVPVIVLNDGSVLRITLSAPLARQASYTLTLTDTTATDDSTLSEPYTIQFTTSGGPQVTSTNIATYKTSLTPNIVIQFDSVLLPQVNAGQFVSIRVGAGPVAAAAKLQGSTITIKPTATLPACTAVTIVVAEGLTNQFSIGGGTAWSFTTRTLCQTVYSIGTSVQGRSIRAYSFGTGAAKVVFVGGMHGNEKSSVATLDAFVEDLEKNATAIPANKTIIVIPNLNPDGYAVNSRLNAHNIDLNRNFDANNWQTNVMIPINTSLAGGGGSAPLSEPESSALAAFILQQSPKLVLTYHATARVVISNDAGNSFALAQSYGLHSGYTALMNAASDSTFEYDTTGEFEDWLHDKLQIPALLVELSSMSSNQFTSQKNAMWAMINAN